MKHYLFLLVLMAVCLLMACDNTKPLGMLVQESNKHTTDIASQAVVCYRGMSIDDVNSEYSFNFDQQCLDSVIIGEPPVSDTATEAAKGCNAPFGIDSQKILNDGAHDYVIYKARNTNLSKNADGTWYIESVSNVYFKEPYPQQGDFEDGDFIAFQGKHKCLPAWQGGGCYYHSAKFLENISKQSDSCQTQNLDGLSNPVESMPILADKEDFADVTGVVMAVEIAKNSDPEPDNPHDFIISQIIMKCKDDNLYSVTVMPSYGRVLNKTVVGSPNHSDFGEGDIITVKQTSSLYVDSFFGYYQP